MAYNVWLAGQNILRIDEATKSIALGDGARNGYAVSTHKDVVPNIFRKAILTMEGYRIPGHGLAPGTVARYYTPSTSKDAIVTVVDDDTIQFEPPESEEGIFVYGTHAADVLSIEDDAVTAGLVLTIQHLNDRLKKLEETVS